VNDRYYLQKLETGELTSARNKLLELMLLEENAMSKQELTDTVKQKLNESGFAVTDKEISVALKMITTGSGKSLRLK
jgi:Fe2+ or Zn2+ uptake regulation protein